jgi:hypothetical protein
LCSIMALIFGVRKWVSCWFAIVFSGLINF